MPYQPQLRPDLEQRLAQLDPELRLLEPEDPGFDAFLAQVTALDPTLARRMDEAIIDDQAQEARQIFGKAGAGLTLGSLAGSAFDRAKGKSVRGEKRIRPVTFAAVGAAGVAAIFLFTAFVPDSKSDAAKAQTSTPSTPQTQTVTPSTPVEAASTTPSVPATSDLPTSAVPVTPAPTPIPITQASTPAPAPTSDTAATQTPEPIQTAAPVPLSAQQPSVQQPSAQQTPVRSMPQTSSSQLAPVPLPVGSTPKQSQATLIPPAPTRAFTTMSVPTVTGTGAARTAITSASGETPHPARTAVVQAISTPETQPRSSALTSSPTPAQRAPVQALSAQAESAPKAAPAFVESNAGAGGSVADSSAGGAYGLIGSGNAQMSSSSSSPSLPSASTQDNTVPAGVQQAPNSSAPAGGAATGVQTASADIYAPGSVLTLHLDTGVAVTAGLSQHVWALADDGSIWRGTATLDEKTSRINVTFSAVLKSGRQSAVNAYAESADGEGIGDHVQVVTKGQAQAVMNGPLSAVAGFVQSQSAKTTTVSQGYYSESERPQNFWLALGSGLASSFVVPDTKATAVQLGQLKKGEDVRVRVDVAGSTGQ